MRSTKTMRDHDSADDNVALIQRGYERYAHGDLAGILDLVDLTSCGSTSIPPRPDPEPHVCRGRHELQHALERQRRQGLRSELEEVIARGDQVIVVTRTPGLDAVRARQAGDRNIDVLTVRAGRIVAMRACRDRDEAMKLAGID